MKVIAIIGCGRIARSAHVPALASMENVRVKYVCDKILEKAKKLKEDFPIAENAIDDYKVALADAEVDAVFVLTPNHSHYTITMAALKAGKHVLCEKPITVNYALSCEMANEANARGLMLNIGVCNRHNKSVEILEQMCREGKFGNVYHVYASFRSFRNIPGLGGAFTTKAESGGGVLIDWGVPFFDLILYILGGAKLKTVSCNAYNEMAKDMKAYNYTGYSMWAEDTANIENGVNDVDDYITGYVRTDKASISFNGAWAQNIGGKEMYIDILGDKGGARLNYRGQFTFWDGTTLQSYTTDHDIPNMYLEQDKAFLAAIESNVKDKNHIDYVLESARLLEALYESAAQNKEMILS